MTDKKSALHGAGPGIGQAIANIAGGITWFLFLAAIGISMNCQGWITLIK